MSEPPPDAEKAVAEKQSPYAALAYLDFRWFLSGNLLFLFGSQMQSAAIQWEMYERTGSKLYLALLGATQVTPIVLLALPAGQVIDRLDRRHVIIGSLFALMVGSLGLAAISFWSLDVHLIFLCVFINGAARAFQQPAKQALLPQLVPRERFASAVTFGTSSFQFATVIGPAVGGLLMGLLGGAKWIYLVDGLLAVWFIFAVCMIAPRPPLPTTEPISLESLGAGLAFLMRTKLLLGAITLDMFAYLFAGVTALLPMYSRDILKLGPESLGWLKAASGIGALIVSVVLANMPPIRRSGATLLWSVVGFGFAMIVFGFSRNFWLCWAMLVLGGGLDMVSVIIRHTLIQLWTPDAMRGRVSAVNGLFINVSNELGEFESGTVAHLFDREDDPAFGPTVSAVSGGIGSLLVVVVIAILFPKLRQHGRLDELPAKAD